MLESVDTVLPGPVPVGWFRTAGPLGRVEWLRDRDEQLALVGGRFDWRVGWGRHGRWVRLIPGDGCALRLNAAGSLDRGAVVGLADVVAGRAAAETLYAAARHLHAEAQLLDAVPFMVPGTVASAVVTSEPPDEELVARIRLPFLVVLVFFDQVPLTD